MCPLLPHLLHVTVRFFVGGSVDELESVAMVRCLLCVGSDIELQLAVGTVSVFFCGFGKLGFGHVMSAANVE